MFIDITVAGTLWLFYQLTSSQSWSDSKILKKGLERNSRLPGVASSTNGVAALLLLQLLLLLQQQLLIASC